MGSPSGELGTYKVGECHLYTHINDFLSLPAQEKEKIGLSVFLLVLAALGLALSAFLLCDKPRWCFFFACAWGICIWLCCCLNLQMGKQQLHPLVQSRRTPRSWRCWKQQQLIASLNAIYFMCCKRQRGKKGSVILVKTAL